ncbi:MAG: ribosome-binding factor [Humisphaera sp.]|nr:ribosome-binding factor [Humisphaera sp.]
MSRRTEMLGSTIQRELASMILRDLNDPRLSGLPSITRVKISPDLSIADVYVTIMGTPGHQEAALNALKHSAGLMRTRLTKVLSIRQAPFLKFHLDEGLKKELALLDAIRKANEEDRQRTGGDAPAADDGNDDAPPITDTPEA